VSQLAEAYDYCQELTRREAKNFYYGFALLPRPKRRAIYSAYAFARQCDDIVDADLPRDQAATQIAAYRRTFEESLSGTRDTPVFQALGRTIERYEVPPDHFRDLIAGCEMDLVQTRYASFDDLKEYCRRVASSVGLISIEIFGYKGGEKARRHAADLGIALQLTNILRDIQEDAARGRIYLPLDELEWFGYGPDDLASGRITHDFKRLMAFQVDRARHYYDEGRRLLPFLPGRARACVGVMAGIYSAILDGIARDPAVVFERRLSLSTGQKLALAGRELARSVVA
jgi:phytoene synthase